MGDDSRSTGRDLVASVHQIARNQIVAIEEQRNAVEASRSIELALVRLAELIAAGHRNSSDEHQDMVDHVDDLPGRILRMSREGKFDPPAPAIVPPAPPKLTIEGGEPSAEGDGNLDVRVGGKRVVFISATVRAALLWAIARFLPWALALGGGGYVVHDQATRGDRQAQQRRLDVREQKLEIPAEPKQLREPRLELPAHAPHPAP